MIVAPSPFPTLTEAAFDLRSNEAQELLWWCAERLYILLIVVLICATGIICANLTRERWFHHINKVMPDDEEEGR